MEARDAERLERGAEAWWHSPWLDALAFVGTLVLAWRGRWSAGDLVWSLWLSSLVVGYSIIVWTIVRPALTVVRGAWRDRAMIPLGPALIVAPLMLAGGLFVLAFFTVHFGMFHYVHSQFLATIFPVTPDPHHLGAGMATYRVVFRRYWRFLPAAFLAERGAFLGASSWAAPTPPRTAGDVGGKPQVVAAAAAAHGGAMWAPYRNVVRMHVLIFFFLFAHVVKLDNFLVYAVVYATYFFPWRVVKTGTR